MAVIPPRAEVGIISGTLLKSALPLIAKIIMYYVYILYSRKLGKKYIGFSTNIIKRLQQHNKGESTFTSRGIPWRIIYYQCFLSKEDALKEEQFLKTGKGRERLKILLEKTMMKI